jgi:hypothetical protein
LVSSTRKGKKKKILRQKKVAFSEKKKDQIVSWMLVAHTCNPSSTLGRGQEGRGSKPAQANSSGDPNSKKPITKKDWQSGSRCRS